MDSYEEKIVELLRRLPNRANDRADRANCPDEEILAIFLGGHLLENRRKEVETHLAKCSFCLEDFVAAYKSSQDCATKRVPQRLIDKAMGFVEGKETLFDLAVRLVKDSIELVSTSGRVASAPVPAAIRRGPKLSEGSILQLEKEVGRFRVAVEMDLKEPGVCQVVANVTEESGEPAEGVRLSLSAGDREQASFLTRGGVVVFDRIAPGEYIIAVSEAGNAVGRIRLNLMLER